MTDRWKMPRRLRGASASRSLLGLLVVCGVALAGFVVATVPAPARVLHPLPPASLTVNPTQGPKGTNVTVSGQCPPAYITNPPYYGIPVAGIYANANLGPYPLTGGFLVQGGAFSGPGQIENVPPGVYSVNATCGIYDARGRPAIPQGGVLRVGFTPTTPFCVQPSLLCQYPWAVFLEGKLQGWSAFADKLIGEITQPFLPAQAPTTTTTSPSTTTTPSQKSGSGGLPPPPQGGAPPAPVGPQPTTTTTTTTPCYPPDYRLPDGTCFRNR